MFIFSIRASSIKFFGILLLTLLVLVGIMISGEAASASAAAGEVKLSGIKTEEDRIAFLGSFGIKVDSEAEEKAFIMPENFDKIMAGYNEIQRAQGLDLTKYAKKRITRYTYKVSNWDDIKDTYASGDQIRATDSLPPEVYATLFVYRNRVVALDISSAEMGGFVLPIIK